MPLTILDNIAIATPCKEDWNAMKGDERRRLCEACALHVYDLGAMTTAAAIELIESTEGRRCIRLHRRTDGRVITKDCPVALARVRRGVAAAIMTAAGLATMVAGAIFVAKNGEASVDLRNAPPVKKVCAWVSGTQTQVPMPGQMMIVPVATPSPTATPAKASLKSKASAKHVARK